MKDSKGITITNTFQKILDKSGCKRNKTGVDIGSEFYNRLMKSWLQDNDIEMYSTTNKGKSAVDKRFIRSLKNKLCKYITSVSVNVYIDKLADKFNEYNNTHRPNTTK